MSLNLTVSAQWPLTRLCQSPRGPGSRRDVGICCRSARKLLPAKVEWFKASRYAENGRSRSQIKAGQRFNFVHIEDNGLYYCKLNDTWGPGTELQAARFIDIPQALLQSKMKDGLVLLQGLLLATCIGAVLLRKRQLVRNKTTKNHCSARGIKPTIFTSRAKITWELQLFLITQMSTMLSTYHQVTTKI
ncbi:hypothetical protein EYF80_004862 [Liparis tanakae]|uniref:Ig-like domain-containing protein n=1 Tax=Liparis tanakae TaxID=230148 RepID=A0A4Z2J469_9TELE|nr:hypothetical protein EYF80_004862 [Liparis tanakae]